MAIALAFHKASLPAELLGDLRTLAEDARVPLACRSSSALEDALGRPFAGVYGTKMIPGNQPDDGRAVPGAGRRDQVRLRDHVLRRGARLPPGRRRAARAGEDGGRRPGGRRPPPRRPLLSRPLRRRPLVQLLPRRTGRARGGRRRPRASASARRSSTAASSGPSRPPTRASGRRSAPRASGSRRRRRRCGPSTWARRPRTTRWRRPSTWSRRASPTPRRTARCATPRRPTTPTPTGSCPAPAGPARASSTSRRCSRGTSCRSCPCCAGSCAPARRSSARRSRSSSRCRCRRASRGRFGFLQVRPLARLARGGGRSAERDMAGPRVLVASSGALGNGRHEVRDVVYVEPVALRGPAHAGDRRRDRAAQPAAGGRGPALPPRRLRPVGLERPVARDPGALGPDRRRPRASSRRRSRR